MRNTNRDNDDEGESGRIDESKSGESRLITESNSPPEEKAVENKPAKAIDSTPATVSRPLARDLYDWASRLTAEAGGSEEYYWTPDVERLVTKLKLTKRALIGVVGVQGSGKSAAMRAVADRIAGEEGFDCEHVIAVKVAETGGLLGACKSAFGDTYSESVESNIQEELENQISLNSSLRHRIQRLAIRTNNQEMMSQLRQTLQQGGIKGTLCPGLRQLVPIRTVRKFEAETLMTIIENQRVILIDMPDYPKHDRRLIARDLDDIQSLWNHLMTQPDTLSNTSIVVFIQKETFNHADHFLYGKMDLIDLLPLTGSQLLEAYARKWGGYAPFTQDALQYVARMSRGVFRRFKRYIALALETLQIGERGQADISSALIDLELVKKSVTDEEVLRDMDKELDGIFRKREQKEKALELIKHLATSKAYGYNLNDASQVVEHAMKQEEVSKLLDISEMAASRLLRELEQHGYIKRFTRPRRIFGGEEKIVQLNW